MLLPGNNFRSSNAVDVSCLLYDTCVLHLPTAARLVRCKRSMEVICTKAVRRKRLKANKVRFIHMKKGTR